MTVALVAALALVSGVPTASAADWVVQGEKDPSVFDCDHLYHSNYRNGFEQANGAGGDATIENSLITKRTGGGPPDYWSSNMAMGRDPDTGKVAAFYSNYTSGARKLYKHVSGTNTVTDQIAGGATRDLPPGTNWGGLTADASTGMMYGAQNGGRPKLFQLNLATGASQVWERGRNLTSVPLDDPVFAGGSLVPDLFVDREGGAYYGIIYRGSTYIYRLDPATGTTTQAVKVVGPGSSNGFDNYGMAYHNGSIYLGHYSGALYRVDPRTGVSAQVAGGVVQNNRTGTVQPEAPGSWFITDLASCGVSPNLTSELVVEKTADKRIAKPGETVTYTITAENRGIAPHTGAKVTDDLTGVVDDAEYNNDATAKDGAADTPTQPAYDSATKKLEWTGDIAPGRTVTIEYTVTVNKPPGGDKELKNTITAPDSNCADPATDTSCGTATPIALLTMKKTSTPADPGPGDTVTYTVLLRNDGTADWDAATLVDDLSEVVDDARYNDDGAAKKADGSPAGSAVTYTEADRKLRWTGDVAKRSTVTITYTVTVGEPPSGDRKLTNVVVGPDGSNCPPDSADPDCGTDEPISGLVIRKTVSPREVEPGGTITYTVTAENVGRAPYPGVTLTDDLSGVVDDARYNNDAVAKTDGANTPTQPSYAAPTLRWTGDIAAGKTVTVTYTVTVGTPPAGDRKLKNSVTGPDGSTCVTGTEPECTTETLVGALDIEKTVDKQDAKPGDQVTYTVTVENTGEANYPGASFTDDLTGVLDDATWDDVVTKTAGTTAFDAGTKKFRWNGDVAKGATITVTYRVTVGKPPAGDKKLKNSVIGPDGSTCPPGNTDPRCGEETAIGLLELKKTVSPATAKPGEKITYTITATNPGTGVYQGARFTDDLTGVLDDATYNNDHLARGGGTVGYTEPTLTWSHDLPAGDTVIITYSVTVKADGTGDDELRNAVTGPEGSTCPPGTSRPECNQVTPVAVLNISKIAYPENPKPGETITYTIQLTNVGKAKYVGASFTDNLSGVLDDAVYNNDARATEGTISYSAPVLSWSGDVTVDTAVGISYTVTIGSPPTGDKKLKNTVTGTPDTNCETGSADPDCGTETAVPALKIVKTGGPNDVVTGDVARYTVTVENIGEAAYAGASFTDDLTDVLDDATWNGDQKADAGTLAFTSPRLLWTGDLARGAKVTITYSVTVTNKGNQRLRNVVTGEGSNCETDSNDPDCRSELPTPKLDITKKAAPAETGPGGKVTYTITLRNTGNADQRGASFTDDLFGVLDDAVYNNDASATSGAVSYGAPRLTWRGDVAKGAAVTLTYSVTVGSPPGGDKVLRNTVTSPDDTNCPPSTHAMRQLFRIETAKADPGCGTETPVKSMKIRKEATPGMVEPGKTVNYAVTVTNTGGADYDKANFTDELRDVLSSATYNGDLKATAGTASLTGTVLTWSGKLAVGAKVTVTYSVTVNRDVKDERKLRNVVTTTTTGGSCATGAEPDCSTTTTVTVTTPPGTPPPGEPDGTEPGPKPPKPGPLAETGSPLTDMLLGALFLLLAGTAVRLAGRRRSVR
ncbi:internalin [Amycolatopsis sp. cmx-4-54]|uniref:DUF7927 domain-containing protein n=1 Tax=Amycolatopsis sp. cmx-4-54 TaxID=2790936 RepID=UPI00397BCB45